MDSFFFTPVVEELWDSMQSYPPLHKGTVLILNFLNRFVSLAEARNTCKLKCPVEKVSFI